MHVVVEEAPETPGPAPTGPQVLLLSARTAEALEQSRAALPGNVRPRRTELSDVAFTLAGRRQRFGWQRSSPTAHAAAVLSAAEHDNVLVGESSRRRRQAKTESFSFFRARAHSMSGWHAAFTSPSRCSPSTSMSAPQGSARNRFRPAGGGVRRSRAEPGAHRPGPTRPIRRGIRAGEADRVLRGSRGGTRGTQHRRVRGGHCGGGLRPADGAQGGVDARPPDARITPRRHGRGGADRTPSPNTCRRRRPRRVNDPGSCVVAGSDENIRNFHDRLAERASWLAGSARRTRSIRG